MLFRSALNFRAVLQSTKSSDFDNITQNAITFLHSQRMYKVRHFLVVLSHVSLTCTPKDPFGSLQSPCRFNSRGAHRSYSSPGRPEHACDSSGQQGLESPSTSSRACQFTRAPRTSVPFRRLYDGNPFLRSSSKYIHMLTSFVSRNLPSLTGKNGEEVFSIKFRSRSAMAAPFHSRYLDVNLWQARGHY